MRLDCMMGVFAVCTAAVILLYTTSLSLLVLTSAAPLSALPSVNTTLYWMNHTQWLSMQSWYERRGHDYGGVIAPLHALLLCLFSKLNTMLWPRERIPSQKEQEASLHLLAFCLICLFISISFPVAWLWSRKVATLLLEEEEGYQAEAKTAIQRQMTVMGTFTLQLILLPALLAEVSSTRPVALGSVLCLWALYFLLKDEAALHPSVSSYKADNKLFDFSKPIVSVNGIRCFPMRRIPTLSYLLLFWFLLCVACGVEPRVLSLIPAAGVWVVTACYQRAFRRVLVLAKAESILKKGSKAEDTTVVNGEEMIHVGFSCYKDRVFFWWSIVALLLIAVTVAGALLLPFSPNVLSNGGIRDTFISTFTSSHGMRAGVPTALAKGIITTTTTVGTTTPIELMDFSPLLPFPFISHTVSPISASVSGGLEARDAKCLSFSNSTTNAYCPLPSSNLWFVAEYLGLLPWTLVFESFVSFFTTATGQQVPTLAFRWFVSITVLSVALLHIVPVFALCVYRWHAPPLVFNSSSKGRVAMERKPQEQQKTKKSDDVGGKQGGVHSLGNRTYAHTTTMKSLLRGAYIVKQIAICCWFLLFSDIAGFLFLAWGNNRGPVYFVAPLAPAACLFSLHVMFMWLKRSNKDNYHGVSGNILPKQEQPLCGTSHTEKGDMWCIVFLTAAVYVSLIVSTMPYTQGTVMKVLVLMLYMAFTLLVILTAVLVMSYRLLSRRIVVCVTLAILALIGCGIPLWCGADYCDAMRGAIVSGLLLFSTAVYSSTRIVKYAFDVEDIVVDA